MTHTVLQLTGSPTDEFHADLSRVYAAGSVHALGASTGHRMVIAHVEPSGAWCFPHDLTAEAVAAAPRMALPAALEHIRGLGVDVAIPQMFCPAGLTSYRSLLDVLGIPFLGNTAHVMATTADKAMTRAIVGAAGVAVPQGTVVRPGDPAPELTGAVVVKPVASDNSVGVTLVQDVSGLDAALRTAFDQGDAALVEDYVPLGREVRCGIVVEDGSPVCLPLEEYAVDAEHKPIRDRADKLARSDDGHLHLVAKDTEHAWIVAGDDPVVPRVHAAARIAHDALGCRHHSLFDFRIDPDGTPWFLEAGPYCSFAPESVVVTMAAAAGIDLARLFQMSLDEIRSQPTDEKANT